MLESRGLSFRSSHRAMSKEVLIVGGGVVGLSIAYYLASTNHSVRIIERDDSLAKSCSEGNAGMVVPSHFISTCCSGRHLSGIKMDAQSRQAHSIYVRASPLHWLAGSGFSPNTLPGDMFPILRNSCVISLSKADAYTSNFRKMKTSRSSKKDSSCSVNRTPD